MLKPRCFVIGPIEGRFDKVVNTYIKPALAEKYEIEAAGEEITDAIKDFIFYALRDYDLAVAYIGAPARGQIDPQRWYWNANVMLEAGYRMGLEKPIVFVREPRTSDDEPLLPFDLADGSTVVLPPKAKEDDDREKPWRDVAISEIKESAAARDPHDVGDGPYPSLTMRFEPGRDGRVTEARKSAAELFGFNDRTDLLGLEVTKLIDWILDKMVPNANLRKAFYDEQYRLLGEIRGNRRPLASVCMVFGKAEEPDRIPNAHLPMITGWVENKRGVLTIDMIYPDVKGLAQRDKDGVVRCRFA